MKILTQTLYKLFIKRRFALILLVLLLAEAGSAAVKIDRAALSDRASRDTYLKYISEFAGKLTEDKKTELAELEAERQNVRDSIEKLNKSYADGEIDLGQYTQRRDELNSLNSGSDGYTVFLQRVDHAKFSGSEIFDDTAWEVLFDGSVDAPAVICVIIMLVLLCIRDEETGMTYLQRTTRGGRTELWRRYALTGVLLSFAIGVISGLVRYVTTDILYPVEFPDVPAVELDRFNGTASSLSLGGLWISTVLIVSLGLSWLAMLTFMAGTLLRNSLRAGAAAALIAFVPPYVFGDVRAAFYLPLPLPLLSADKLLCGLQGSSSSEYVNFSFSQLCLIFAVMAVSGVLMAVIGMIFGSGRNGE